MSRTKMYTIVCSLIYNSELIEVKLDKMLELLDITPREMRDPESGIYWGIDYGVDELIVYNLTHYDSVMYYIKEVKTTYNYNNMYTSYDINSLKQPLEYLNHTHSYLLRKMSDDEFEQRFRYSGTKFK